LFYDLEKNEVIDYIGGVADLNRKILQTVGSAQQRFSEDHLRILRGIRFVAQLGFTLSAETALAIEHSAHLVKDVSAERKQSEMEKLLTSANRD